MRQGLAGAGDALTVALHLQLLQVLGKTPQGVVVGEHGAAACSEEIAVPNLEQGEDHRHVRRLRGAFEVSVHLRRAREHGFEAAHADLQRDRQPHRRPK